MNCVVCGNDLKGLQKKYCCNNCKAKGHYMFSEKNTYVRQTERSKKRKLMFIKKLGGCCKFCGYNKNYASLDFHHTRDKKFALESRKIGNTNIDILLKELEKCLLLCANCHREIHYPQCNME